jgi:hypothetical protein
MDARLSDSSQTASVSLDDVLSFLSEDRAYVSGLVGIKYRLVDSETEPFMSMDEKTPIRVPAARPELFLLLITEQLREGKDTHALCFQCCDVVVDYS